MHERFTSAPGTPKPAKKSKPKSKAASMTNKASSNAKQSSQEWRKSTTRSYEYRMIGSSQSCIERYCELAKIDSKSLKKVATPCIDDHTLPPEDFQKKGALSPVASKIVLKALYLARLARPDLLWTVNSLARNVTKWTVADDKRVHRLMSYIQHTGNHVMKSFVGDEAKECQIMLFCDASFAGDLMDSKSTSGAIMCLVGPNTFAPISWICKKQGAVSHSSTEAEVISMDAGMRLEAVPALTLWEIVLEVMNPETAKADRNVEPTRKANGKRSKFGGNAKQTDIKHAETEFELPADFKTLLECDYVPPSLPPLKGIGKLIICEDNDAVIKMCIKGRSPNMRHVPRTHRVDLDWLFERILKDPSISIKYVNTKQQLADILTRIFHGANTERALQTHSNCRNLCS